MSKTIRWAIMVWLLALAQVIPLGGIACADQCANLLAQAKKERSIIKRLALYKSAVLVCPDHSEIIYSYAFSLERLGKAQEALLQYQRVIQLEPGHAKSFFNMGDIYRNQGESAKAIKAYQQGLKISPGNPRVEKRLRVLSQEQ